MASFAYHSKVAQSLYKKYNHSFYFYTSKAINQFVYQVGNVPSINYEDLKLLNDDVEYLRRMYRNKNLQGKNQIQERVKLVSKFYHENNMLTSQMPMMFITKTKQLFLKRQKRLKHIKKQQLSASNQPNESSSSFQSESFTFSNNKQSSEYLKQLKLGFSQLMIQDSQEYLNLNDQLDSSVHDVFQSPQQDYLVNQSNQGVKFTLDVRNSHYSLSHLVYDFEDVDVQEAINLYKQIAKSKNGSAIMSQILQEQYRMSSKNSQKQKSKQNYKIQIKPHLQYNRNNLLKSSKQSVLNNYVSIFGSRPPKPKSKQKVKSSQLIKKQYKPNRLNGNLFADKYFDQYHKIGLKPIQNQEDQDQYSKTLAKPTNCTKIRQKAQKLLQKINKQSFSLQFR